MTGILAAAPISLVCTDITAWLDRGDRRRRRGLRIPESSIGRLPLFNAPAPETAFRLRVERAAATVFPQLVLTARSAPLLARESGGGPLDPIEMKAQVGADRLDAEMQS